MFNFIGQMLNFKKIHVCGGLVVTVSYFQNIYLNTVVLYKLIADMTFTAKMF